jgi:hypothetical protein
MHIYAHIRTYTHIYAYIHTYTHCIRNIFVRTLIHTQAYTSCTQMMCMHNYHTFSVRKHTQQYAVMSNIVCAHIRRYSCVYETILGLYADVYDQVHVYAQSMQVFIDIRKPCILNLRRHTDILYIRTHSHAYACIRTHTHWHTSLHMSVCTWQELRVVSS